MVPSVTFPVYNLMYHQECLSEDRLNHPARDWMLRTAVVTAVFAFGCGGMTNYSNKFTLTVEHLHTVVYANEAIFVGYWHPSQTFNK